MKGIANSNKHGMNKTNNMDLYSVSFLCLFFNPLTQCGSSLCGI